MEVHNKMKRVIACLLLVASLLAVCVIGASAQQGKNVIGEIGLYNGNITLDGVKDAAYTQYGTRFRADYWEGWGENKTGTIYGDFWFVFTDNYEKLHVYTEMHDDVIIAPSASKHSWSDGVCHTDCAEIWIDPTNNAGQYGKSDLRGAAGASEKTKKQRAPHQNGTLSVFSQLPLHAPAPHTMPCGFRLAKKKTEPGKSRL